MPACRTEFGQREAHHTSTTPPGRPSARWQRFVDERPIYGAILGLLYQPTDLAAGDDEEAAARQAVAG